MAERLPFALWADLLGRPFLEGGRGPQAFDCVGLLLELQRRLGHALPPWGSHARNLSAAMDHWRRVEDPEPGDGILFLSDNPPWHIGVVCGQGFMLHAHPSCGVARERYNGFPWQNRIRGFYRVHGNS